jgi:hypothetical protein
LRKELFEELLESVQQGGAILRGEMKPFRVFEFSDPGVRTIRFAPFAAFAGFVVQSLAIPKPAHLQVAFEMVAAQSCVDRMSSKVTGTF